MNVYFADGRCATNVDENIALRWAQEDANRLIAWSKITKLSIDKRKQDKDSVIGTSLC